jgi:hypothetical protein
MKSSTRRNIRDRKSEHENSGIRLKNGELLPIEVITSFLTSASESFGSAVSADLNREIRGIGFLFGAGRAKVEQF